MEAIGGIVAVVAGVGVAIGLVVLAIKKYSPRS